MITTGIIRQINKSSDSDHNGNLFSVELPIFETPANKVDEDFIIDCTCCSIPGAFNLYKPGDTVYIGFINNEFHHPVILGKIYRGTNNDNEGRGLFNADSFNLTNSLQISPNATINGTSIEYLETLLSQAGDYFDQLQISQRYIHEIKLTDDTQNPSYDIRLDITNNQGKRMEVVADLFSNIQLTNTPIIPISNIIPFYPAKGFYNNTKSVMGIKIQEDKHFYVSKIDNNSATPPSTNWQESALNEWSSGTYNEFDAVKYNGDIYIALTTTTSDPTNTTNWIKVDEIIFYNPIDSYNKYKLVETDIIISIITVDSNGSISIENLTNSAKLYYTYESTGNINIPRVTF